MHALFTSLFNAGDLDRLVALYEPQAVLIPGPEPVRGTDAIRTALRGFLDLGGSISIRTTAVFEGPGIALLHGEWSLNGGTTELAGKSAEVLRRQPDGRWLYVVDNPWV
jgi:ketosteroid isomerase-like protein